MRINSADQAQLAQPIGTAVTSQTIDSTERQLDLSALKSGGYPYKVEVEARGAGMYYLQGDSSVTLPATSPRMKAEEWRVFVVKSADYEYLAIKQETGATGTAVATLIGESD